MPIRKVRLVEGEIYHIYNRSVAELEIFKCSQDYSRMLGLISYYSIASPPCKFSLFQSLSGSGKAPDVDLSKKLTQIIAYCIMPTHIHLILKEIGCGDISNFANRALEGYSKYFNIKYKRKGPLWEGRFNNVLVESNEQLIHLTRYIHLNPVTAFLTNRPENWQYSSYREYIKIFPHKKICDFSAYMLGLDQISYKKFVNDQIDYQRALGKAKKYTP